MCEKTQFKQFTDPNGTLCPIEFDSLPFEPKRIFYVCGVPKGTERGNHAHYKTKQVLICVQGKILVKLFDGDTISEHVLDPGDSILVKNLVWDSQIFLTGNDVLLSLASTNYDANDYITDRDIFLKINQDPKHIFEARVELESVRKSRPVEGTRYTNRAGWLELATSFTTINGLWLEFGVFDGGSLETLAKQTTKPVYGFDSFEGLPEDWTTNDKTRSKGLWSRNGKLPQLATRPNIQLVVGWFDQTLPQFLQKHSEPCALIHIDCDIYKSTKTVFDNLKNRIVPGTIICFDDLTGYKEYYEGEMKAWLEFVQETSIKYEWLAHERPRSAAILRIIE